MANPETYRLSWSSLWMTVLSWQLLAMPASADTPLPLHRRIDATLDQYLAGPRAGRAADATLVRRIYLDLTGSIPSADEAKRFIEDSSPEKWEKLVDSLLADPRFVDHMTNYWDVAMMERLADKHVKAAQWRDFLEQALRENRPFNQLAADILGADGRDAKARGAARFYLDREAEPNRLTRDIGRVFFGVDLQCAQCHDHPLIDDYYQADYYGLYAFVSRLSLFTDKKKVSYLSEKADGEVKYTSVFTSEAGRSNPRLPLAAEIGNDPDFEGGDAYEVAPSKDAAGVPKYSRRERLAEEVAKGDNPAFRRNISNRLWAVMMGRGLVHPVDLHHSDNPAAHPELLHLLSDEIAALKFDMRAFLKQIALTQAYQRDFKLPLDWPTLGDGLAEKQSTWQMEVETAQAALNTADAAMYESADKLSVARQECFTAEDQLSKLRADATAKKAAYDKVAAPLAKAKSEAGVHEKALKLVDEALAAAKRSGVEEEPVVGVVKLLQTKRQPIAAKHAAAQATVERLTKTTAPQKAAWDKAVDAEKPVREKVAQLNQRRLEAEAAFQETELRAKTARQQVYVWQARIDESKLLETAAAQLEAFQQQSRIAESARTKLEPVAALRDPLADKQGELADSLAAAQSKQVDAETRSSALQEQIDGMSNSLNLLSEINASLQQESLASETELASVLKVTTAREAALSSLLKQKKLEGDVATQDLSKVEERVKQLTADIAMTKLQLAKLDSQWTPLKEAAVAAEKQLDTAKAQLDESRELLRAEWSRRFALTGLKALTPEQLCWSVLEATGQIRVQATAAAAALNKKSPLSADDQKDPVKVAARESAALEAGKVKLKGNVATFVKLFAAGPGQPQHEFFATADQALFFRNGSQIRGWIAAGGDTLFGRLAKLKDDAQLADRMYLSVLSRFPDEAEREDVIKYLAVEPAQRNTAIQEMIWALITSIEFRFRH